jgi:hypothetical protein
VLQTDNPALLPQEELGEQDIMEEVQEEMEEV